LGAFFLKTFGYIRKRFYLCCINLNNGKMEHKYGELVPDKIIDSFYKQIKKCIDEKRSYEHYINNLIKINGRIPDLIKKLIT
jgi:hypothetical protein